MFEFFFFNLLLGFPKIKTGESSGRWLPRGTSRQLTTAFYAATILRQRTLTELDKLFVSEVESCHLSLTSQIIYKRFGHLFL